MKILDKFVVNHYNKMQVKEKRALENIGSLKMATVGAQGLMERGPSEGQDRISFELSSAVGGRILNVRRYQDKFDRHENQTYVIPSGEDVGARVSKIINLELIK
jgi:hypothetical protein